MEKEKRKRNTTFSTILFWGEVWGLLYRVFWFAEDMRVKSILAAILFDFFLSATVVRLLLT
jgi:hypothetical protein